MEERGVVSESLSLSGMQLNNTFRMPARLNVLKGVGRRERE